MNRIGSANHWVKLLIILVVSTGLGLISNAVRPNRLPWVIDPATSLNPGENKDLAERITVSLDEFRRRYEAGTAQFVDARKAEEFEAGHLEGAISIPSIEVDLYLERIFETLSFDQPVIIYCEGGDCESSHVVYEFLILNGFPSESLYIYFPGWEVLGNEETGLPIAEGAYDEE